MKMIRSIAGSLAILLVAPQVVQAQDILRHQVRDRGVSALWMLANISYAGMRAQNNRSGGWRILAFIFGLPGTILTFFAVPEGGERAYGIEIPTSRSSIPPLDIDE
jgi:hypothetical protein